MPSGKKSKQQRRAAATAPPPVRSKGGGPARRQASPRVLAAAGGVVALVVIGVVLAVVLGGGSKSPVGTLPTTGSVANGLPEAGLVQTELKGIPQKGNVLGSASAPVTLVEYVDLQCPFCQQFETQVMPSILKTYVRPGKVKVEVRVLDFIGPDSKRGRDAMIAAGFQNKAFDFAQLLYYNQQTENTGWLNDAMVAQAAESIPGVNPRQLFADRSSSRVKQQASGFDLAGTEDKVTGTPTLFVGKSGTKGKQVPITSPTDKATLVQALDAALGA